MRTTIVGRVADRLGHVEQRTLRQGRHGPELVKEFSALPGVEYRTVQRVGTPLELEHQRLVGTVKFFHRTPDGDVWAVAEVDRPELVPAGARYLSPTVGCDSDRRDIDVESVSLTATPASWGAPPVVELPGSLSEAVRETCRVRDRFIRDLLEMAFRHRGPDVTLAGGDFGRFEPASRRREPIAHRSGGYMIVDGQRLEVEIRPGGPVLAVNGRPVGRSA